MRPLIPARRGHALVAPPPASSGRRPSGSAEEIRGGVADAVLHRVRVVLCRALRASGALSRCFRRVACPLAVLLLLLTTLREPTSLRFPGFGHHSTPKENGGQRTYTIHGARPRRARWYPTNRPTTAATTKSSRQASLPALRLGA